MSSISQPGGSPAATTARGARTRGPRSSVTDVRCENCRVLLGRREANQLTIRRGPLQVTIDGTYHASLVCYRCGTLRVLLVAGAVPAAR